MFVLINKNKNSEKVTDRDRCVIMDLSRFQNKSR